eukprot:SAG22_NODE_1503_length_4277_cov_18.029440_4_plen_136_part_00
MRIHEKTGGIHMDPVDSYVSTPVLSACYLMPPMRTTSPLSAMTSLTTLFLRDNQITDIAPLSAMTSLTILFLRDNQITDIAPLSTLTLLTAGFVTDYTETIYKKGSQKNIDTAIQLEPGLISHCPNGTRQFGHGA